MTISIKQHSKKITDNLWEWDLSVSAAPSDMEKISDVSYALHETFDDPAQTVNDRATDFAVKATGWPGFPGYAIIHFKNSGAPDMKIPIHLVVEEDPVTVN